MCAFRFFFDKPEKEFASFNRLMQKDRPFVQWTHLLLLMPNASNWTWLCRGSNLPAVKVSLWKHPPLGGCLLLVGGSLVKAHQLQHAVLQIYQTSIYQISTKFRILKIYSKKSEKNLGSSKCRMESNVIFFFKNECTLELSIFSFISCPSVF